MQMQKNESKTFIRFFAAGLLCFAAAYLSEKTLGAIATFPFILILPGLAYLIYEKIWHITGFCAIAAFVFKCVFSSEIKEILAFTVFCVVLGAVSAMVFEQIRNIAFKKKKGKNTVLKFLVFVACFVIYIFFYGTIFGNLTSNRLNTEYLEKTYPDEQFLTGSTYYSYADGCYVTEFGFTAKERYKALVSVDKNGNKASDGFASIDGYRDHIKYEILNIGQNNIRSALSTFVYEGSDYVIRNRTVDTGDVLTSSSTYAEYRDKTCFEIALYYQFDTKEAFEEMCRSYIEHLDKYESVVYKEIIFYGFDDGENEDFAYTLNHTFGSDEIKSTAFDSSSYSRYFSEKDTHKYWELLG